MLLEGLRGTHTPYDSPRKRLHVTQHEVKDADGNVFTQLSYRMGDAKAIEPELVVRRINNSTAVITDMDGKTYSEVMRIEDACALLADINPKHHKRAP